MGKEGLKTPVLFIVFSRPETTKLVFEEIRKARPSQLFIAADAPREGNEDQRKRCEEVRKIVANVDWPCKVKRLYQKKNLGCRVGVSSAINWFFDNVEKGIILEDDTLPDQSFFKFSEELLEKYEDDERIMMISGNNFQRGFKRNDYSYYFSKYTHIWGWASWRRAWRKFDVDTKMYPELKREGYMKDLYGVFLERKFMTKWMDAVHYNKFNTWDYQWTFSVAVNNGLVILPNKNLVSNIGIGVNATHTSLQMDSYLALPAERMNFPLKHPNFIIRDCMLDKRYFKWSLKKKVKNLILRKTGFIKIFQIRRG